MAAKKSAKPKANPVGRPTKYTPQRCQDLIDHMKQGGSIEAFGAYVGEKYGIEHAISKDTVYEWADVYSDFSDAKRIAEAYSAKFYDDVGRQGMLGNLRRIVSEKPVVVDGKVVLGADGKVVKQYEYEPATFNSTAWIFTRKNCHGWTDKLQHSGQIKGNASVGDALSKILSDPTLAAAAKSIAEKLVEEED